MKRTLFIPLLIACMCIFTICAAAAPTTDVAIDAANFPDSLFRTYISVNFDEDNDGMLSDSEIREVTNINVSELGIYDLTGIAYFTALKTLDCSYNNLEQLEIQHNTKLRELNCAVNLIASLDVSQNTKLLKLDCGWNKLSVLDMQNNAKLWYLSCHGNQLTELKTDNLSNLVWLHCEYNQLTALDVSHNPLLAIFVCNDNQLTALDLSQNPELGYLDCSRNMLPYLDVSSNLLLEGFHCDDNRRVPLGANAGVGYDMSILIPNLQVEKISDLKNGTIDGKILTIDEYIATYTYDCGNGFSAQFRLACGMEAISFYRPIDEEHYPDPVFRTYISEHFDTDHDGNLSDAECDAVFEIDVSGRGVKTLEGIRDFVNLRYLDCSDNKLHNLTIVAPDLRLINYSGTQISSIDLSLVTGLLWHISDDVQTGMGWQLPYEDISDEIKVDAKKLAAIRFVTENGYMIGTSADKNHPTFSPEAVLTRAQYVTTLGRMANLDVTIYSDNGNFSDVKADDWFSPYVAWANENGIILGYDTGVFGATDEITIEQAIVILARFAAYQKKIATDAETDSETAPAADLNTYADANEVSDWATGAMIWAIDNGLYEANADGTLAPKALTSRMLTAMLVYLYDSTL